MQWAVWCAVRREVLHHGATSALQACRAIIDRHGAIRVVGEVTTTIVDPATLHQWYRAAERSRSTDPNLAARCSSWEQDSLNQWRDRAAGQAAARSVADSTAAGLFATGQAVEAFLRADAAAAIGRGSAGTAPKLRKNRRR